MMRALIVSCLMVLAGCASRAPLPAATPTLDLPLQVHVQRVQAGQSQDWLLVIQREDGALRWSLLDFLGIPQARQRLLEQRWQADGLLPPNPEARELFAAVLFALTPTEELAAGYPDAAATNGGRRLGERWIVVYPPASSHSLAGPASVCVGPNAAGTASRDDGAPIHSANARFTLQLQHGLTYRISPLPQEPAP
jgi:hypothetical protein